MKLLLPLLAALLAAPAMATEGDLRSVAGMQFHNRVLVAFTPSLKDPRIEQQRRMIARLALQAAERDLILVQVGPRAVIGAHDDAAKLRRRFKVPEGEYRTLLIGKDGHVVSSAPGPVSAAAVMRRIDAMPMRREELRRAHAVDRPPSGPR